MARTMAVRVAEAFGRTVVVTAGIHDDGLDRTGIETYLALADKLAEAVVTSLAEDPIPEYNRVE